MKNLITFLALHLIFSTTVYGQIHIDAVGNVGIGISSPQGKLHVDEPGAYLGLAFTGSGLNDLTVNNGAFTGTVSTAYAIRMQNTGPVPNIIEVSSNGGSTWSAPTPISNPINLTNGVTAIFASTSGHTFGDRWDWTVNKSFSNSLIVKNGMTGIGTATPTQKLDVNGKVRMRDLSLDNTKDSILVASGDGTVAYRDASTLSATACNFSIGDSTAGGIIFYLDASGCHGLISATTDQSTGIQWWNGSNVDTYAYGNGIGAGEGNSQGIRRWQGDCSSCYASELCQDLSLGGYTDWYLPSKYELNLMYENIGQGNSLGLGNVGAFANFDYWSSTESQ